MCGIVGLFVKSPALEPRLGAMLSDMLGVMWLRKRARNPEGADEA